jgi:hypothetical protein
MNGKILRKEERGALLSSAGMQQTLEVKKNNRIMQFHQPREDSTHYTNGVVCIEVLQDLLKRQGSIVTIEVTDEIDLQQNLVEEITVLTHHLKLETERISDAVRMDRVKLESLQIHTCGSKQEIVDQRAKMFIRTNYTFSSAFGSVISIIYVMILFSVTYFFIRLFPSSSPTYRYY